MDTRSVQRIGQPPRESVETGLRRAVHVVGATHPRPRDGREHDDAAAAHRAHRRGECRQQRHLGREVGVHDGGGVRGIDLRPRLIAEDAERDHRGTDRAVLLGDRRHDPLVRCQIVGVELARVNGGRAGVGQGGDLGGEPVGTARGEHHVRAAGQPLGDLDANLTATAEDHDQSRVSCQLVSVLHGSDYDLR